jgi:putative heme-binding domain-containing protein
MRWLTLLVVSGLATMGNAQQSPEVREQYRRFALEHAGDPARGALLFRQHEKLVCSNCHEIAAAEKSGPNLDGIADKYSRADLIQQLLEPSASIKPGYESVTVITKQGQVFAGRVRLSSRLEYKLIDAAGKAISIPQEDIEEIHASLVSMMPENLTASISHQEFADLVAYLESLRSAVQTGFAGPDQPLEIPLLATPIEFRPVHPPEVKFDNPVWFVPIPGQTRQYVVLEQQEGRAWRLDRSTDPPNKELFVDLHADIAISPNQGLMCLAFHPRYVENGRYFVKHETKEGGRVKTVVIERKASDNHLRDSGQPSRRLLALEQPALNNSGGCLMFGPDGKLYIAFGDGGPSYDKNGLSQNLAILQGSILRIDVDRQAAALESELPYGIPADNPFVGLSRGEQGVRAEAWAYGFREPWRISFDRLTGDLWVGDVGQDKFEEVAIVRRGENHGWNVLEGFAPYSDEYRRAGETYTAPLFMYPHSFGIAIVGGYVYRGDPRSSFYGTYIFGDYESRRVWGLRQTEGRVTGVREIGRAPQHIASFAEDESGEIYLVGYEGTVFHLDLAATRFE